MIRGNSFQNLLSDRLHQTQEEQENAAMNDSKEGEAGAVPATPPPYPLANGNAAAAPDQSAKKRRLEEMEEELLANQKDVTLKEWIIKQETPQEAIGVRVCDPRLVPRNGRRASTSALPNVLGPSKTVHYVIESTKNEDGVERSFSDFCQLRELLTSRFPGAAVPALPERRTMGSNKESFIRKRARLLEIFLQACADHPFLKNDVTFQVFIEHATPFEACMKKLERSQPSVGTARWRQLLRNWARPRDSFQTIALIRRELVSTQKALTAVKAAAKKDVECAIERSESTKAVAEALDSWLGVEKGIVTNHTLGGEIALDVVEIAPAGGTKTITSTLAQIVASLAHKTASHASVMLRFYGEDQLEMTILDAARYELLTIGVWLEMLSEAEAHGKKCMKAEDIVGSYENMMGFKRNGNPPVAAGGSEGSAGEGTQHPTPIVPGKLREARVVLRDLKAHALKWEAGLLGFEFGRLRMNRVLRWMRLKRALRGMHIEGLSHIRQIWENDADLPPPLLALGPVVGVGGGSSFFSSDAGSRRRSSAFSVASTVSSSSALSATIGGGATVAPPAPAPPPQPPPELTKDEVEKITVKAVTQVIKTATAESDAKRTEKETQVIQMFWALALTVIVSQLVLASVLVMRGGFLREAFSVSTSSVVTLGVAYVVELSYKRGGG